MKSPWKAKSSPWLYDHEVPLRVHVRRLARLSAEHAYSKGRIAVGNAKHFVTHPREAWQWAQSWFWRRVWTLITALILVWMLFLYQTEFVVFEKAIGSCDWSSWEQWVRVLTLLTLRRVSN